jgi:hypothetical protein
MAPGTLIIVSPDYNYIRPKSFGRGEVRISWFTRGCKTTEVARGGTTKIDRGRKRTKGKRV